MENENLKLWDEVRTPDPSYVKDAVISGRKISCVDAQYKKWMITREFGVYGDKWGVEPDSETFERIHYPNDTCLLQYTATAYYRNDSKNRYQFPIASSIKEAYVTKNGNGYLKIDDDAVKKVRTDALTKGFTDLGFCADIFLGKWDDNRYVQDVRLELDYKEQTEHLMTSIEVIIKGLEGEDLQSASEAWFELDDEEKSLLWKAPSKGGYFSTKQRETLKSKEFRESFYGVKDE